MSRPPRSQPSAPLQASAPEPQTAQPPALRDDRLVSVVIPTRNAAGHLARTLAAVFDQAPAAGVKLEVVVADEGSTDDTAVIACRAGARVILLGGPGGRGLDGSLGSPRERGAAAAVGHPVVFLDSASVPAPDWLRSVLADHDRAAPGG